MGTEKILSRVGGEVKELLAELSDKKNCREIAREAYIAGAREFTIVQYTEEVLRAYARRAFP